MKVYKQRLLKKIDNLVGYEAKLIFLNNEYLKASSTEKCEVILKMLEDLKRWGK